MSDRKEEPDVSDGDIVPSVEPAAPWSPIAVPLLIVRKLATWA